MAPNLLEQAGSRSTKETRFAPIFTNRFFTGIWTQRNALRDPSGVAYERWYGGRPDAILSGVNIELTNKLTLARRQGTFPFSTALFPGAINSFYPFRQFTTNTENITVMVDDATAIYTLSPTAKVPIYIKSTGAGASNAYFQSVGNTLYIGDGADQIAFVPATIVSVTITNTSLTSNVATYNAMNSFIAGQLIMVVGTTNGGGVFNVTNQPIVSANSTSFTLAITHADVASSPDTGTATYEGIRNWGIAINNLNDTIGPNSLSTPPGGGAPIVGGTPDGTDPTNTWTRPTYVASNDPTQPATIALTGSPHSVVNSPPLFCEEFGLTVPSTTLITGIQITLAAETTLNSTGTNLITCQLLKNGNPIGAAYSAVIGPYNTVVPLTFGSGTTDLWQTTWSYADINAAWGVQITAAVVNPAGSSVATFNISEVQAFIYGSGGPTVTTTTGSLSPSTGYQYVIAYGNTQSGAVSVATPPSVLIKPVSQGVSVSLVASTDPQVNAIYIFRTKDGGSVYYNLPDSPQPNVTTSFTDNNADTTLNLLQLADLIGLNAVPPAGLIGMQYHMNRLWGFVGNTLYFSTGPDLGNVLGNGNEGWLRLNNFVFPERIIRLVPTSSGLIVFTTSNVYIIYGNGSAIAGAANSNVVVFYPSPFIQDIGLLSPYGLDVNGTTIYMLTADGQLLSLDPTSGMSEIGFPIGDQLQLFPRNTLYVAWHVSGSTDKALYVSDDSSGWFRCNTSQAPDGGFVWSPKANIVGGCSAIQAIEYPPGVHNLLIGPGTSGGKVLCRNDSQAGPITNTSLTSNIATYTTNNNFIVGQRVNVTGTTNGGGVLNTFNAIITAVTPTSFQLAFAQPNVSSAPDSGSAILSNTDNGLGYPSNCVMGSLVLAQPGQLAELGFITCDFPKIGTSPLVSVLLNEISGTFESLSGYVHSDPPSLYGATGSPTSLYSNRYDFLQTVGANTGQTPLPAFCRHMQIQLDYGSTDVVQNELLTLTIFGAHWQEA